MGVIEILTWLAGAGAAAVSAFVLERISSFQALSPNGKQMVAFSIAVVIGALAIAARDYLVAQPDVIVQIEPYVQMVIAAGAILIQQLAHGAQRKADAKNG
jgi:uncharacterized membrane protein YeiH